MSTNLYAASQQWQSRPADERFETLEALLAATRYHRQHAATATLPVNQLRVEYVNAGGFANGLQLVGPKGNGANLTHWSFGQLAQRIGAPADYLRGLPANLAADNINHGLRKSDGEALALFTRANLPAVVGTDGAALSSSSSSGGNQLTVRALTTDSYTRIWSYEIIERLLNLEAQGWRVPPARPAFENQPGARRATEADVLRISQANSSLAVKVGDMIAPAGLYASDHDCFVFMVNESRRIDDGSEGGLARGFFVSNSETGAASLRFTRFLYRAVCANHIVWGAKGVQELRIVHRGAADQRFAGQMMGELRKYADQSASDDESRIAAAKRFVIANSKDDVLDLLFGKKILPRKALEAAYEYAIEEGDIHAAGSPKTAWGMAQGVTRLSQDQPFADKRVEIDRAAGKILELAF